MYLLINKRRFWKAIRRIYRSIEIYWISIFKYFDKDSICNKTCSNGANYQIILGTYNRKMQEYEV